MHRSRWLITSIVASLVALAGCASSAESDESNDAITGSSGGTGVARDQLETGNCWLFATVGWIEDLEAKASGASHQPEPISVAYIDYWDWFEKITGGRIEGDGKLGDQLDSGGSWGEAGELVLRYGIMRRGPFRGDGANATTRDASLVTAARDKMVESLTSGALKTKTARKDRALVRTELEKAFGLSRATSAALTEVFGEDGKKNFTNGARSSATITSAEDMPALVVHPDAAAESRTLADVIGRRRDGDNPDHRVGPYAWSDVQFNAHGTRDIRDYFKRIQRALHAGVRLPIAWYYPSNVDPGNKGEVRSVPSTPGDLDESVFHETLLTDYEADVPGIGRLKAGQQATKAQMDAALSDDTKIIFLRVIDTYGAKRGSVTHETNDLYMDYLLGTATACPKNAPPTSPKCEKWRVLGDVTFPAGF